MTELVPFYFVNQVLIPLLSMPDIINDFIIPLCLVIVFCTSYAAEILLNAVEDSEKEKSRERSRMDVRYEYEQGLYYVYDSVDPTGTSLRYLASGRNYTFVTKYNNSCIVFSGNSTRTTSTGRVVKLTVLPDRSALVERDNTIYSRNAPIVKTVQANGVVTYNVR